MALTLNIDKSLYPGVLEYSLSNGLTAAVNGVFDQTEGYTFPITAPASGLAALNLELRFKKSNFDGISMRRMNNKQYELTDHLGNVRALVGSSLKKVGNEVQPTLIASTEYYPFGMSISSLSTNSEKYRYRFNGMEKDDEIKGSGKSYDFGVRIYDPRICRWLSLDPLAAKYPQISPYVFCANSPIFFIDPDGKRLQVANVESFDVLLSSLPKEARNIIQLDNNGYILSNSVDIALAKYTNSGNLQALKTIVDDNRSVVFDAKKNCYQFFDTEKGKTEENYF